MHVLQGKMKCVQGQPQRDRVRLICRSVQRMANCAAGRFRIRIWYIHQPATPDIAGWCPYGSYAYLYL